LKHVSPEAWKLMKSLTLKLTLKCKDMRNADISNKHGLRDVQLGFLPHGCVGRITAQRVEDNPSLFRLP
jgi:hypothetical protein